MRLDRRIFSWSSASKSLTERMRLRDAREVRWVKEWFGREARKREKERPMYEERENEEEMDGGGDEDDILLG